MQDVHLAPALDRLRRLVEGDEMRHEIEVAPESGSGGAVRKLIPLSGRIFYGEPGPPRRKMLSFTPA